MTPIDPFGDLIRVCTCRGWSPELCPSCEADATLTEWECPRCDGTGTVRDDLDRTITCAACNGSGVQE